MYNLLLESVSWINTFNHKSPNKILSGPVIRPGILIGLLLGIINIASSQDFSLMPENIFKEVAGKNLAFAGGLRAPQLSKADLNLDGIDDIVLFEKEGELIVPLIRNMSNSKLEYRPEYRDLFPPARNWLLMRDFNRDGIMDIFCSPTQSPIPGVEVWKGKIVGNQLQFELVHFAGPLGNVLTIPVGNTSVQIYVSVADLPDIRDVDGDGDLDILSFEPAGSTVYLHKNMEKERNLPADSLQFTLGDICFGKFVESGFSQEIKLSQSPSSCASNFLTDSEILLQNRHSGSAITLIQGSQDSLPNLLIGDISYPGLIFLQNGGTKAKAWMTSQIVKFPNALDPVNIQLFNGAFIDDFNGDGQRDLVVGPTDRYSSQTLDNLWYYEFPNGIVSPDNAILRTRNFLLDEMLYYGSNTSPVFFDINADGLTDIVLGASGRSPNGIDKFPQLLYFKNVGSPKSPSYKLESPDYLGMSNFRNNSAAFFPAFGDLDGDSDIDLIIGDDTGRLYYLENNSGSKDSLHFSSPVYGAFEIRVSAWARPEIYDWNGDGLADLILGEQNFNSSNGEKGSLNYFQNIGNIANPVFNPDVESSPNDPLFGDVFIKDPAFISNYSSPRIFLTSEGPVLVSGSENGKIYMYKAQGNSFELLDGNFGEIDEGFLSMIDMEDIDGDGYYELAIGTRRGGLALFNTTLIKDKSTASTDLRIDKGIVLYPNPVRETLSINLKNGCKDCLLQIFDISGRMLESIRLNEFSPGFQLNVSNLKEGIYFIKLNAKEYAKFVKLD